MTQGPALRLAVLLLVTALVLPALAGSAVAIHEDGESSTPTADDASTHENGDRRDSTVVRETVQTTTNVASTARGDRTDRDRASIANATLLDLLDDGEVDLIRSAGSAVGSTDQIGDRMSLDQLAEDGTLSDVPLSASGEDPAGPDGTSDGVARHPGPGTPAPAPDDPSGVPDETAAGIVGVGVGGVALAGLARRGALLSATMPLVGAASPGQTARGLLDRGLRVFYPLRYSRYDDSDPLEHETRQRVHAVVEDDPGTYLSAVSEAADVPLSTARHHVRILEREGLLASAKVRGKRRFYPAEVDEVARAAAIDDGAAATVLEALARLGPCSVADLADELDRDSSTITYHLQRLEADDLVERERTGRTVENRLVDALEEALAPEEAGPVAAGGVGSPADD